MSKVRRVVGVLSPEKLYTKEGLMRYGGVGPESLRNACSSGIVQPLFVGRRVYYAGDQVIQWIRSSAADHPPGQPNSSVARHV